MIDTVIAIFSVVFLVVGAIFFAAGTLGMLRFPDVYTRLHAMTKADNLGVFFIVVGVALTAPTISDVVKLVLTWGLILVAGTTAAHLVARAALREDVEAREAE